MRKKITIEDLADAMSTGFESARIETENLAATMNAGFESLRHDIKFSIEELAIMVAQGFEKTATKEELTTGLKSLRTELKSDIQELKTDLTQTIFREAGRIDKRIDQITFRPNIKQ